MAETKNVIFTQITEKSNQSMQVPVKEDLIVPDTKPDIGRILKTKVRFQLDEKSLDNGRLHWRGNLVCQILYAGEEDARELHSMEHVFKVDEFMNLELPDGDGRIRYTVQGEIGDIKTTVLNSRKLNLQAVIQIKADVNRQNEHSVISQVEGIGQLQVRKTEKMISALCLDREEKYMVKDEIKIAESAPNIHEILWWEAAVVRIEPRLMDGKASIKGEVMVNVLYRGENASEPAEYLEGCISFQGLLDAPIICDGLPVKLTVRPSELAVRQTADEDGEPRIVLVEATLDCHIQMYEQQNLTVIEDIYAPGWDICPKWKISEAKCFRKQESILQHVSETIAIPEIYPEALQLFGASGEPLVDDFYTVEGVLNADGLLKVQLFYLSADDRYPLAALQEVLPFLVSIDGIPDEEITLDLQPVLLDLHVELINGREVKVDADIRMDVLIMGDETVPVMTDLKITPKDASELDAKPSMIVYIVQPGEDLWHIAKEHDTTPERIAKINHLEEEKEIPAGRQLLLLKEA